MKILEEIRTSVKKHKELVTDLSRKIIADGKLFGELIDSLETGTDVEKGTIAEVLKYVTAERPEQALPYIDTLIKYINYKAPRVMWGVPEAIGNIGRKYPDKVETATPLLIENTKNKSTVIRWCAAYALTEIAKASQKISNQLMSVFIQITAREQNNGVKNVYLKALGKKDRPLG